MAFVSSVQNHIICARNIANESNVIVHLQWNSQTDWVYGEWRKAWHMPYIDEDAYCFGNLL